MEMLGLVTMALVRGVGGRPGNHRTSHRGPLAHCGLPGGVPARIPLRRGVGAVRKHRGSGLRSGGTAVPAGSSRRQYLRGGSGRRIPPRIRWTGRWPRGVSLRGRIRGHAGRVGGSFRLGLFGLPSLRLARSLRTQGSLGAALGRGRIHGFDAGSRGRRPLCGDGSADSGPGNGQQRRRHHVAHDPAGGAARPCRRCGHPGYPLPTAGCPRETTP